MVSEISRPFELWSPVAASGGAAKIARQNLLMALLCVGAAAFAVTADADPNGFATPWSLSDITVAGGSTGKGGFTINGTGVATQFATTIANAGDLNGDGIDDIAIGAASASPDGRINAGRISVIYGRTERRRTGQSAAALHSRNGGDGRIGFVVNGIATDDAAGASLDIACDINGDAIDDLIIGAPGASLAGAPFLGETYVVFGSTRGLTAEVELASLLAINGGDGRAGFVVRGMHAGGASGATAESAGDVNGDGLCDVVIAAPGAAQAYVVLGSHARFAAEIDAASLFESNGSAGFVIDASDAGANAIVVGSVGDINGDRLDDLAIGLPGAGASSRPLVGPTYILPGSRDGVGPILSVASLLAMPANGNKRGFLLTGGADVHAGARPAGDLNGDGIDDLAVSAPHASPNRIRGAGTTYVVLGSGAGFPAEFMLDDLHAANGGDGRRGFVASGFRHDGALGSGTAAAGDLNNDGVDDLLIAAPHSDVGNARHAGEIYILFGSKDGFAPEAGLAQLLAQNRRDARKGTVLQGAERFEFAGVSLANGGDINGDGIGDVLIGAHRRDNLGRFGSGRVYALYGRNE